MATRKVSNQTHKEKFSLSFDANAQSYTVTAANKNTWQFSVHALEQGFFCIHQQQPFTVHLIHKNQDTQIIDINGESHELKIQDPKQADRAGSGKNQTNSKQLKANMPGRVVSIAVKPGDEIKKGQSLIVLEAMKMENQLKAAVDGIIDHVHVQADQSVEGGALLISFRL